MAVDIIMAGGQGERFWPLTHEKFPKYRIQFEGKESLLARTYRRLKKTYPANKIFVVTTKEHVPMIRSEVPALVLKNIIVEPSRHNTACAIYLSCSVIKKLFDDKEVVTFFPADHLIKNEVLFQTTLKEAIRYASNHDSLVTIGISPTFPATGYGYIQVGRKVQNNVHRVASFVEKPNLSTACKYLKAKNFLWNGGIFSWKCGVLIQELESSTPAFKKYFDISNLAKSYSLLPSVSIDVALLEKAKNIFVCKTQMDWCDMGSWDMVYNKSSQDKQKNVLGGKTIGKNILSSLVVNHTDKPITLLDVDNLIVVQTKQGTLICRRGVAEQAALLSKNIH